MKHVRYTGSAQVREVSAADFKSLGVDNQNLIRLKGRNAITSRDVRVTRLPDVAEVTDEAADALVNNGNFEVVNPPKK